MHRRREQTEDAVAAVGQQARAVGNPSPAERQVEQHPTIAHLLAALRRSAVNRGRK